MQKLTDEDTAQSEPSEMDMLRADFNDVNAERQRWKTLALQAAEELKALRALRLSDGPATGSGVTIEQIDAALLTVTNNDRNSIFRECRAAILPLLGKNPAPTPEASMGDKIDREMLASIKRTIDYRINDLLCETKPDYDDSLVGINAAWDVVRKVFAEHLASLPGLRGQA